MTELQLVPAPRFTRAGRRLPAPIDRGGVWEHTITFTSGPRHAIRPVKVDGRAWCDACGVALQEVKR